MSKKINVFWFRRDLRLEDNTGLQAALSDGLPVLPLFIFDKNILDDLQDKDDARVSFLHQRIHQLDKQLSSEAGGMQVYYGEPLAIWETLCAEREIAGVYTNRDYEPYGKKRDQALEEFLQKRGIGFYTFKDQVIFEKSEITTDDGNFYKVFTPYKNKWMKKFEAAMPQIASKWPSGSQWVSSEEAPSIPTLADMGFEASSIPIPDAEVDAALIRSYDKTRNFPAQRGTTRLGIHLRFGTLSIRELALRAHGLNETYLTELIWREFYQMILHHNPQVVDKAFKPQYDAIPWRADEEGFEAWCQGNTGYPIVDAGMRELNATGYMHNRVRMIVASFLTKHLLIDWRWGEAYFARKLLDFELASNNGGWQWAAGTGTDAQPYFRVFNPESQTEKFDKDLKYIKKWVPEYGTVKYPKPMVDHKFARQRAIDTYKEALAKE